MTNSERALFARGSRAPVLQQLRSAHHPSRVSVLLCLRYLAFSCIHVCLFSLVSPPCPTLSLPPSNLRCHFGITVSCTRSGGGPIRKCACSCPTWKGRTPPSVLCRPSRPRKWLMRPSYECRVVPRGIFKIKPTEALSGEKNNKKNKQD